MNYGTVLDHIHAGRLQAIRFGKRNYHVSEEALASFIEASIVGHEVGPIADRDTPKLAQFQRGQKPGPHRTRPMEITTKNEWRKEFRNG